MPTWGGCSLPEGSKSGYFANGSKIESLERENLEPNIETSPENPPVALQGEMWGNFFAGAVWSMLLGRVFRGLISYSTLT